MYFSLDEMTLSQTAIRAGIDNTPNDMAMGNLHRLTRELDRVRVILGAPVHISSGYRSLELNARVGGSGRSAHMFGRAADFTCPAFGTPRKIVETLKAEMVEFDQLICEFDRWVHFGIHEFDAVPRHQVLEIDAKGTRPFEVTK
jgi:hypothetical protein